MHFSRANSLVMQTMPFILLRLAVYSVFAIGILFYFSIVSVFSIILGLVHSSLSPIVWIVGLLASFPLTRLVREYLLYMVKAAHVAVLAELATKGTLPDGMSQITWGRKQVQQRFGATSILFIMDRLVNSVVHAINSTMSRIGGFFDIIPGVGGLVQLANKVLYFSLTYVDESILARNFLNDKETIWQSAENGLVLYAQAWKSILKTAFFLGLIAMIVFPVLFIIFMVPALTLASIWPSKQPLFFIAAFLFAYVLKAAFLDPWTLANMILTYLEATKGLSPDREWTQKLEMISSKFKKIRENNTAGTTAPTVA